MNIVWFKRDLRKFDNAALMQASQQGHVLPIYILEPELWQQADMDYRHYLFLQRSLQELSCSLSELGQPLIIEVGNALEVLQKLYTSYPNFTLWSHQETWNFWTFQRDKTIRAWCNLQRIVWHEPVQNGVIRCLKNRNGWSVRWQKAMQQPLIASPKSLTAIQASSDPLPTPFELGLSQNGFRQGQKGGRSEGIHLLQNFLYESGENYTKSMSSPVTAPKKCSRLSAHLAFGTLSMREVFHAYQQRSQAIKALPRDQKGLWPIALHSFSGRLRWHCHFIQKLESEPRIEFENLHPEYNKIRQQPANEEYLCS